MTRRGLGLVAVTLGLATAAGAEAPNPLAEVARRVRSEALSRTAAFDRLVELCDGIGHRLSGSKALEAAVAWAQVRLTSDGHENVRLDPVQVPHWQRGAESAELVSPRPMALAMLGLGGSVGTPPEGVTAEVVVVSDDTALAALAPDAVKGKIVLFDHAMPAWTPERGTGYGTAVKYRVVGAVLAAKAGAVASLIRSVTAHSLRTPHTGMMRYEDGVPKIPHAALAVEDAALLARLAKSGHKPVVRLRMEARTLEPAPSHNVLAELVGRDLPREIVLLGAHLDSWDVGQGAHDDGAGVVMAMEALTVLRRLGLRPRRTVRVVLFTNEENGLAGGKAYASMHGTELHVAAIETDSGGFAPRGLAVGLPDAAAERTAVPRLGAWLRAVDPGLGFGAVEARGDGGGADISPLAKNGVPLFAYLVEESRYFDVHHTAADTVDKVDPTDLARGAAFLATVAWSFAESGPP